jgi:hypothetical protein
MRLLERFWQAGYPPRYATLLRPSSPSSDHALAGFRGGGVVR